MRLVIAILAISSGLIASQSLADSMRMAVTSSFNNSGLSDVLLPEIRNDLGFDVHLLIVGTGQALGLGRNGDVDAVLVHARAAEEEFVATGFGVRRCHVMYNDFVIIGPEDDPAGVADATEAQVALTLIAAAGNDFVSRGDDSGTHKRELALWNKAGLDPGGFEGWYKEVGSGMGSALNTASGLSAYIIADRASWLTFGNPGHLVLLFEGDPDLFNQYTYMRINPERHPHVKADIASRLESWLTGPRATDLIDNHKVGFQPLFVSNPGCD